MRQAGIAAAVGALSLLSFFRFPGHTWLQQDTQIYVAIMEHERDPRVLAADILVAESHVAFTLYDEIALAARRVTGLGFHEVLAGQQFVARALGIWGLYLLALSLLEGQAGLSLLAAAIVSLGAGITGPEVLTFEYEPSPRAIAYPLVMCGLGLASAGRPRAAAILGAIGLIYHPPSALPFCLLLGLLAWRRRDLRSCLPMLAGFVLVVISAGFQSQGAAAGFFRTLTPADQRLLRMRAAYNWISTWGASLILHWLLVFGIACGGWLRLRRQAAGGLLITLAALGILSMPVSWLLLEWAGWAFLPELQPMRNLLWTALAAQLFAAVAGIRSARRGSMLESVAWLAAAFALPAQNVLTRTWPWQHVLVVAGLAALSAGLVWLAGRQTWRWAPAVAATAGFFVIPGWGQVVNYPRLHTPELEQLAAWARSATPSDAVFAFPDARKVPYPGIFRAEALRAVYVDWKGGGQVNFLPHFAAQWWLRWQQTMGRPADLAQCNSLGIQYVVLASPDRLPGAPVFENTRFTVYRTRPEPRP
ncbi:MAG: DUF6798 domain-containing protein [Bryobacteraceae bacterium]|jgi:hypothetical protein